MSLWSLTRERYEKLLNQKEDKAKELKELLKLSAKDLWNKDLDNFLVAWDKFLEQDFEERSNVIPTKGSKKRARNINGSKKKIKIEPVVKKEPKSQITNKKPTTTKVKTEEASQQSTLPAFFTSSNAQKTKKEAPKVVSLFSDSEDDEIFGTKTPSVNPSPLSKGTNSKLDTFFTKSSSQSTPKPKKKFTIQDELADLEIGFNQESKPVKRTKNLELLRVKVIMMTMLCHWMMKVMKAQHKKVTDLMKKIELIYIK